jgi:hypothetical protein
MQRLALLIALAGVATFAATARGRARPRHGVGCRHGRRTGGHDRRRARRSLPEARRRTRDDARPRVCDFNYELDVQVTIDRKRFFDEDGALVRRLPDRRSVSRIETRIQDSSFSR